MLRYSEKFCITSKTNSREIKKKKRAGEAMEEMEKNRWGCETRVTFLLDFLPMFCVVYIILIYRTTDSTLQCVKSPKVPDKKQKISPVLLNPPCLTSPGLIETQTDCGEIIQINYESLIPLCNLCRQAWRRCWSHTVNNRTRLFTLALFVLWINTIHYAIQIYYPLNRDKIHSYFPPSL